MSEQYQRAKEIFLMVCDLPPEKRAAVIKLECGSDEKLRAEVQSLIDHYDATNKTREAKRFENAETAPRGVGGSEKFSIEPGSPQPTPERIGRYRVIRRLGVGGMGIVYLAARDDDQFKKRVAIKVIKKGMDSEEILRRFEQERQVLSALNHPNIARLIDGGSTNDGRPYFVMEYIEGMAIDEYCDKNRLRIDERLELFRVLCKAVHHAHQNLIVHRDIKPSNVVVMQDGTLKLLDFGIAKLLNPDMAAFASEPTATSLRLMTPEYASPEQVRGDPLSTSSDVYSLGVLLYELVTGRRPYRFKTRLQSEIERIICTEDPEKPSTAITHEPEPDASPPTPVPLSGHTKPHSTIEEIARAREAKPDRLRRRLSGDIDNIVLMAMRKEARRRYTSAEQFGDDIRRHLDGMPVIARSATWSYRAGKFVQRNRAGVAAAAVIAVALTGWALTASTLYAEATTQRQIAEDQRDKVVRVQRFTSAILADLPTELSSMAGANEAMAQVAQHAKGYLENFTAIGHEPNELDVATSYARLGDAQSSVRRGGLGNHTEARKNYQTALTMFRALGAQDPADAQMARSIAVCLLKLGDVTRTDDRRAALPLYQESIDICQDVLKKDAANADVKRVLAGTLSSLGDVYNDLGDQQNMRDAYLRSVAIREELHKANPNNESDERRYGVGLLRVAEIFTTSGVHLEAQKYYETNLNLRRKLLALTPDHSRRQRDVANALMFLGQCLAEQKKFNEARALLLNSHEIHRKLSEADPKNAQAQRDVANCHYILANLAMSEHLAAQANRNEEAGIAAAKVAQESYQAAAKCLEPLSKENIGDLERLANAYQYWAAMDEVLGNLQEAKQHLQLALDLCKTLVITKPDYQKSIDSIQEALARLKPS